MGASISVTTTNIVMEALEEQALSSFTPQPKAFYRYVDDCFGILRKEDSSRFLQAPNAVEPRLAFHVSVERKNG